ncbi:MAG: phage shock protein PspA [Gammaproteobacteria bacterium]|nr:MAG: phage shock protein PspA [Gammaproteobacteria bacterium]
MGIFSRFTDIINSNINSLLDKAEDPAKMVRLIIQEMEDTLVEVRSTSAKTLAEKKDLSRQVTRSEQEAIQWQEKAELALSKNREDLARAALQEKKKCSENASAISDELAHIDDHITKLQNEVVQLQDKLADAKARQKSILLREKTVSSRLKVKRNIQSSKVSDALSRFDSYERKIDDLESQVEAYDLGSKSLADEIADLAEDEKIDDELAQLKAKMAAPAKNEKKPTPKAAAKKTTLKKTTAKK